MPKAMLSLDKGLDTASFQQYFRLTRHQIKNQLFTSVYISPNRAIITTVRKLSRMLPILYIKLANSEYQLFTEWVLSVNMGDSIDSVVKSWLVDPQWQKVFKHTFDVFQVKKNMILLWKLQSTYKVVSNFWPFAIKPNPFFEMAAMPLPCNVILLIQGNLPRVLPVFT